MPITELNHYLIRARDLERAKDFYCDVLGFEVMPRPDFPFPGYWLGVDGKIQVHMGQADIPNANLYYLGTPAGAAGEHTGVLDHVAFLATDPAAFIARFRQKGIAYRPRSLPEARLFQLFITDPDGLTIELNFIGVSPDADWGGEDYSRMPRVQAGQG